MFRSLVMVAVSLGASCLPGMAGGLSGYDQNGNYVYGNTVPGGRVNMFDQNGSYIYGNISPGGHVDMYDQNGNYSSGNISPDYGQ
jgi:hypothetical protein